MVARVSLSLCLQRFVDASRSGSSCSTCHPESAPSKIQKRRRRRELLKSSEIGTIQNNLIQPHPTSDEMTLLKLLEPPTLENVPEEFDGVLDCSSLAICCSFNRRGSLLAVGCNDGRIVIWDFLTRGVAKNFAAHLCHPICSVR